MDDTDRRRTERQPAGDNRARLLWDEGPDVLESSARLLDTSSDGARFVADSPPPHGHDVCFRLEAPRRSGWVSARVVRLIGPDEGGLSFPGNSPHGLVNDPV